MSRLDRHVALVQNKLAMQKFVDALIYLTPLAVSVAFAARLVQRQTTLTLDLKMWWLGVTVASVAFAIGWAIYRRPKTHDAAVAIDERLGLKEKFSTALAMRHVNDPFAMAAVRDAEHTADNVSLHKRFPLVSPSSSDWRLWTVMILIAAVALLLPEDAFKRKAEAKKQAAVAAERAAVKKAIESDIARVETIAKAFPDNKQAIEAARKELENLKIANQTDPSTARRTAAQTLSELDKAIKDQINKSQEVKDKIANDKVLAGLQPPSADEKGPVAEAHKALAKNDLPKAMDALKEATEKFDKMNDEEKKKAAEQMQKLAQDMAKQAANPAQQQNIANQLQQAGMNQQQAQQVAQQMQQAAAGDKQAQQQLQQAANQAMQQMNNGNGPTPQQQQALQQAMQQGQAAAQGQMTAQQMANAAQQMAQAMQNAANGQPNAANPNGQPGQPGANQQQNMAAANQAMQDQLAQMDAIAKDAAQQQGAAQQAQDAADKAAGECNGGGNGAGNPGPPGGQVAGGQNPGKWGAGDPAGRKGGGQGGPGQAAGGGIGKEEAPFGVKSEHAPVQNNEDGKFIAATYVKGGAIKNDSKATLQEVSASVERTETDDVDAERISGEAKRAVKDYFGQINGQPEKK